MLTTTTDDHANEAQTGQRDTGWLGNRGIHDVVEVGIDEIGRIAAIGYHLAVHGNVEKLRTKFEIREITESGADDSVPVVAINEILDLGGRDTRIIWIRVANIGKAQQDLVARRVPVAATIVAEQVERCTATKGNDLTCVGVDDQQNVAGWRAVDAEARFLPRRVGAVRQSDLGFERELIRNIESVFGGTAIG